MHIFYSNEAQTFLIWEREGKGMERWGEKGGAEWDGRGIEEFVLCHSVCLCVCISG